MTSIYKLLEVFNKQQIRTHFKPKKKTQRSRSSSPNRQQIQTQPIQTHQIQTNQYGPPPHVQTHLPQASYPAYPPPTMNQVPPVQPSQFYNPQPPTNPSKYMNKA